MDSATESESKSNLKHRAIQKKMERKKRLTRRKSLQEHCAKKKNSRKRIQSEPSRTSYKKHKMMEENTSEIIEEEVNKDEESDRSRKRSRPGSAIELDQAALPAVPVDSTHKTLTKEDLHSIVAALYQARAKWKYIGLGLKINSDDLQAIEGENRKLEDCLQCMLIKWLEKGGNNTWEAIVQVLRMPMVGRHDVARQITEKLADKKHKMMEDDAALEIIQEQGNSSTGSQRQRIESGSSSSTSDGVEPDHPRITKDEESVRTRKRSCPGSAAEFSKCNTNILKGNSSIGSQRQRIESSSSSSTSDGVEIDHPRITKDAESVRSSKRSRPGSAAEFGKCNTKMLKGNSSVDSSQRQRTESGSSSSTSDEKDCPYRGSGIKSNKPQPECTRDLVMKVVRQVSSDKLSLLQNKFFRQHEHEEVITLHTNAMAEYDFIKHDVIVDYWFKLESPSWNTLINSLKACGEDDLAAGIESREAFKNSDSFKSLPTSFKIKLFDNEEEIPIVNPITKAGAKILKSSYRKLADAYQELLIDVKKLLKTRSVDKEVFLEEAYNYFPPEIQRDEIKDIEDFFKTAHKYDMLNMWHYGSLQKTLNRVFKNDKNVSCLFVDYEDVLYDILPTIRILDILVKNNLEDSLYKPVHLHDEDSYNDLGMKIDITVEKKTLEYFLSLWKKLQRGVKLNPADVVLAVVRDACIEVKWRVPKNICHALVENSNLFSDLNIVRMWWNSECIYSEDIHIKKNVKLAHFFLSRACENRKILEAKAMLRVPGVPVNSPDILDGKTPLMLAAESGSVEIVSVLLKEKSNPNIKEDKSGRSALHYAAERGHKCVITKLLEKKANILMTDKEGFTILDVTKKSDVVYEYVQEATEIHVQLFDACERGDLQKILSLVKNSIANVSSIRSDGKTPLMLAACQGHAGIIEILVQQEVDVLYEDKDGVLAVDMIKNSPRALKILSEETLIASAATGKVDILKRMLDLNTNVNAIQNDKYRYTPLLWACEKGRQEVVEILLKQGANPDAESTNGWTGLLLACRHAFCGIVKTLLSRRVNVNKRTEDGWTALMLIASKGDREISGLLRREITELLLKKGAEQHLTDKAGFTPLCQAAQDGHYEVVKALVESSESHVDDDHKTSDPNDWTPIMFATKNGHIEIVKYLVDKGADVTRAKEDGNTVLHIAAYNGHVDLVRYYCLKKDVQVDVKDQDGVTALMYASKTGHLGVVKALLQKFPDINTKENHAGWTAPHFAIEGNHIDVFEYILDHKEGISLSHEDVKGNTIIDLALAKNLDAYRSIRAKLPKLINKYQESIQEKIKSKENLEISFAYAERISTRWITKMNSREIDVAAAG